MTGAPGLIRYEGTVLSAYPSRRAAGRMSEAACLADGSLQIHCTAFESLRETGEPATGGMARNSTAGCNLPRAVTLKPLFQAVTIQCWQAKEYRLKSNDGQGRVPRAWRPRPGCGRTEVATSGRLDRDASHGNAIEAALWSGLHERNSDQHRPELGQAGDLELSGGRAPKERPENGLNAVLPVERSGQPAAEVLLANARRPVSKKPEQRVRSSGIAVLAPSDELGARVGLAHIIASAGHENNRARPEYTVGLE
jgi:hypothetical protein